MSDENEKREVAPLSPAQDLAGFLRTVLTDPAITPEKLDAILRMQREILADQAREQFNIAFVAMSAELPQVRRDGRIELRRKDGSSAGSLPFARWEDMDKVLRPIYTRYGFGLSFKSDTSDPGRITVIGKLLHTAGHAETAEMSLPPDIGPGRNALQASGSSVTYGKRYVAEMLLNIVRAGKDTDGFTPDQKITGEQANKIHELMRETNTDSRKFLDAIVPGTEAVNEIQERDFTRCVNALNLKKSRMKEQKNG